MVDKKTIREWCRSSNYRPTFYGDDPSIVILGEKHGTPKHRQKEEEMIENGSKIRKSACWQRS